MDVTKNRFKLVDEDTSIATDEEIRDYEKDSRIMNIITPLDIPADRVIKNAFGKLQDVVVMGYDKDGVEYFASSSGSGPDVLWMLERAKHRLLQMVQDQVDDG